MIYLDYQATTPVAPEVAAAMRPWIETNFGNPHSPHRIGREEVAAVHLHDSVLTQDGQPLGRGVVGRLEVEDRIFHGDLHPENLDVEIPRRNELMPAGGGGMQSSGGRPTARHRP